VFVFALKRKKVPKNDSPLPDELSRVSYLPDETEDLPASERVPVLPPQLSSYLLRNSIATIAMLGLGALSFLTLLFIATKPTPDLVQQDNGVMARVRPLDRRVDSVPDQVVRFLEDRLPRVYTWSGLLVDPDDPTGLKYIHDPGVEASTPKGEGVLLPTTLYNEQFIFDEPIRDKMMRDLAGTIKDGDVDKEIFKNDPAHPSLATVYRFILRGKIEYPQEVSTDRYRVRVAADIVKFSLTQSLGVKAKPIAEFLQDVYVRKASKIPQLMIHDAKRKDLLWYGRKDGFVIDSMVPVGPAQEVPGIPRN
jgi:hypothetical protein